MLEDTPTSRVRSAAQGYVELVGRSQALAGATNIAPLTQRPCVWWRFRIQRRTASSSRGNRRTKWQTVQSGRSEQPFVLDDGTGECIVQPAGAEVLTAETTTWYGETPWPTVAPGKRSPFGEPQYRYYEERIYEHGQVHVLGQFRTHSGTAHSNRDADSSALLAEWKQDQAELVERFDADGDGRVSLEEWVRAREEARRTVTQRKTRIAGLLNTILLIQLLVTVVPAINLMFTPNNGFFFLTPLAFITPLIFMLIGMRRGHIRGVSIALIVFLLIVAVLFGVFSGSRPLVIITYYPLVIVIAGLLLGGTGAVISALASSVLLGLITFAGASGYLPELLPPLPTGIVIFTYAVGLTLIGIVFRLASNSLDPALTRARMGEKQLAESNRELQKFSSSLEATVVERTEELAERTLELEAANKRIQRRAKQFEAVAQVGQAINSIHDLQELLPRISTVISEQAGGRIEAVFFCPHPADSAGACRKPKPGMLQEIAIRYHLELKGVPAIGDSLRDLEAAVAVGARPILVLTGKGRKTLDAGGLPPGVAVHADLAEAVQALLAKAA